MMVELILPLMCVACGTFVFGFMIGAAHSEKDVTKRLKATFELERRILHAQRAMWQNKYFEEALRSTRSGWNPSPGESFGRGHWRSVLKMGSGPVTRKDINAAFVKLAMKYHPDRGGDVKMMKAINVARDQALKEVMV